MRGVEHNETCFRHALLNKEPRPVVAGETPMIRLALSPLFDNYVLTLLLVAALGGLLFLRPGREGLAKKRRRTLALLRAVVILLLLFVMLRPTLVYMETRKLPASLIILLDNSKSMTVNDELNGASRWDASCGHLERAADSLGAIQEDFEVKAYSFSDQPRSLEIVDGRIDFSSIRPNGRETAIGHAMDQVAENESGKRFLAVIILSDGAQRAIAPRDALPQDAAVRLRDAACPIYAISVGRSRRAGGTQDVAVRDLSAPSHVFANNEMIISGQVRVDGYVNRDIPVRLMYETSPGLMEEVDSQVVSVRESGDSVPFQFRYRPTEPGEHKLTVEVPPRSGELVETNNVMSSFVYILTGGLRVLYIEGTQRVESKFIRRALDASPDIDVDYLRFDPTDPTTKPSQLTELLRPGLYSVFILGDMDSSGFTDAEMTQLAESIQRGAGFLTLGGSQSYGPGGYGQTPLAGVYPIEMLPTERQRIGSGFREDLHIPGPITMRPTELGRRHFSLRLEGDLDESAAVWADLPPLDGANRFYRIKSRSASILAETERGDELLVSQLYGGGRVLAFAADGTWRWWLQGHEDINKRFWRQSILWLAKKDESLEGNIWVRPSQRTFAVGETVEFTVGAQSASGDPLTAVSGSATMILPDGTERSVPLTIRDGRLGGVFADTSAVGDYAVRVSIDSNGEPLGEARARFIVVSRDLELENAVADPALMDDIATTTGGRLLAPEELPSLLEQLAESAEDLEERTETKLSLWDRWWVLLLFVALLGVEWYLRKRWGMT